MQNKGKEDARKKRQWEQWQRKSAHGKQREQRKTLGKATGGTREKMDQAQTARFRHKGGGSKKQNPTVTPFFGPHSTPRLGVLQDVQQGHVLAETRHCHGGVVHSPRREPEQKRAPRPKHLALDESCGGHGCFSFIRGAPPGKKMGFLVAFPLNPLQKKSGYPQKQAQPPRTKPQTLAAGGEPIHPMEPCKMSRSPRVASCSIELEHPKTSQQIEHAPIQEHKKKRRNRHGHPGRGFRGSVWEAGLPVGPWNLIAPDAHENPGPVSECRKATCSRWVLSCHPLCCG